MSVNVGSATGFLDLDISGFLKGLKSAQEEANKSTSKIESMGSKFTSVGDKISGVGTKLTTVFTVPLAGMVAAAVKGFADMEQAVGGVETLFKGSASAVIKNSETAYKRAGVSSVEYMNQITSFSASLLQSLGGDTEAAARVGDMAIVDMSDNANKLGTSMESIQTAYQGFAKQNYTMLDNLKLGYGGTKTEMERLLVDAEKLTGIKYDINNLSDVYEAIHAIQVETGISGTTAKEAAETISGSFITAKGAFKDFLANLGNPGADMEKAKQNLIESIQILVGNVKRVLATIWENIPLEGWQKSLIAAVAVAGPFLLVVGKLISGAGALMTAYSNISKGVGLMSAAAAKAGTTLGAILAPIAAVVAVVAVLIAAFVNLWKNNEDFRNKVIAIWERVKEAFQGFTQGIVDRLNALGLNFENITQVISAVWNGFCELLAPLFEGAFTQIVNVLEFVFGIITSILDIFIGLFTGNWGQLWEGVKGVFVSVWELISGTFTNFVGILTGIADTILGWFGTSWSAVWTMVGEFFSNTWMNITTFFTNIAITISTAVSNFITGVITFFSQLPVKIGEFITNAYNSVVTWVVNMVNKAREMGTNFLTNVITFFTQLPGKVLGFVTSVWGHIKTWALNMVNKSREMGTNFLNNVISFFTQLPGKVLGFITSVLQNVGTWVTNMVTKAKEMGTNFLNNVVTFMTQLPGKIKGFLDSAISNLVTWVTQMGQKGTEAVNNLINNVMSAAAGIAGKVLEIGTNIVQGVWSGITNAAGWFISQVTGFFGNIVNNVKSALGIGSPSKVFAKEVGRWLPPGVAKGFEQAMPHAMADIQTALNTGINNIKTNDVDIDANVGVVDNVSGFANALNSLYGSVATWFESVESRMTKSVDNMTRTLLAFMANNQMLLGADGSLGYVGFNGFTPPPKNPREQAYFDNGSGSDGEGDTFVFYSPKPISEVEAARQLKKAKRDLAEGF